MEKAPSSLLESAAQHRIDAVARLGLSRHVRFQASPSGIKTDLTTCRMSPASFQGLTLSPSRLTALLTQSISDDVFRWIESSHLKAITTLVLNVQTEGWNGLLDTLLVLHALSPSLRNLSLTASLSWPHYVRENSLPSIRLPHLVSLRYDVGLCGSSEVLISVLAEACSGTQLRYLSLEYLRRPFWSPAFPGEVLATCGTGLVRLSLRVRSSRARPAASKLLHDAVLAQNLHFENLKSLCPTLRYIALDAIDLHSMECIATSCNTLRLDCSSISTDSFAEAAMALEGEHQLQTMYLENLAVDREKYGKIYRLLKGLGWHFRGLSMCGKTVLFQVERSARLGLYA